MNIVVINGSPSGLKGVSAQHMKYLAQRFPEHRFEVIEAARKIHKIERDQARFAAIVAQLQQADAVIWCFPVYFMLVSAQLKRFIELLFERGVATVLAGKVTTALSTSAHFYDHTAHDYVQGICSDLGMAYVHGYSAGMDGIVTEEGRRNLEGFASNFFLHAAGEAPVEPGMTPVQWTPTEYVPELPPAVAKTGDKKIVVISDAEATDHNLLQMIEVFERSVSSPVARLNLAELRMDGGCLGCMGCADDGVCGYKDDYAAAFDQLVKPADVVIYAGSVRDRFLSARFKVFIDRYFRFGHRPVMPGRLMGYIISGPLGQLATLREVLEANTENAHCQRLGTVTDEQTDPARTTGYLQGMARAVDRWLAEPWVAPQTFLGVGGAKIFRDLVYQNKGIMSADHRFYRDRGFYDYPQARIRQRLFMACLLLLKKLPFLKKQMKQLVASGHTRALRQVTGES